jgi:exopolysaccharide biosynthesis predicted pyruvyltransferase EpsI
MAAPESIVAIKASCPGASTKLIALTNSASELQASQIGFMVKFFGGGQLGHLYMGMSA